MSVRLFDQSNISADTGIVPTVYTGGSGGESIATMRLRMTVNTAQDPFVGAQFLTTIRYHDGKSPREENFALQTFDSGDPLIPNYIEVPIDIWQDFNHALTVQVADNGSPSPGSVDVVLLHGFV